MARRGCQQRALVAGLLVVAALACLFRTGARSFVGTPAPRCSRGERLVARVSAGYLFRNGPRDADVPFKYGRFGGERTQEVEFKKRPFGIMRYQPGSDGKAAMTMEVADKSRYPGDPQGQAFLAGVKSGWIVSKINGKDVAGEDFGKILDLLNDEVADPRFASSTAVALKEQGGPLVEPADLPIKISFVTDMGTGAPKASSQGTPQAVGQDSSAPAVATGVPLHLLF